jgi:hypothetical protein
MEKGALIAGLIPLAIVVFIFLWLVVIPEIKDIGMFK